MTKTMTKTTKNQLISEIEALQVALSGKEVNGVKLLPSNEDWARKHIETLARILNGTSVADA